MDGAECNEAHEVVEELVVSGCDTSEVFEFAEEPLHEVAFLIEVSVIVMLPDALGSWRNDRFGTRVQDGVVEVLGIIGAVRNHEACIQPFNELCSIDHLASVTGAWNEPDRQTETIGGNMQLGA